ncbi:MAG TPA: hypothetical protein VJB17_01190 [Patescibacteria group bacterium]|nr:hypothetical protein [Patescibacteria group bacterium]
MPLISAEKPVNVYFFKSNGCPHCAKEKSFLDNLKADPSFSNIVVNEYEVGSNLKNAQLFSKVGKLLNANVAGVPFTVIGSTQIVGYSNDSSTGELIKSAIKRVQNGDERDILAEFISGNSVSSTTPVSIPEKLTFLGKSLNIKSLSLPGLTMVLALLDGFNPCAMWVLFFLISMILGLESRKKMWLIGSTFIAASGLVYFLILSAWLNVFLLIGYVKWVQLGLGFFALTGGVYTLYKTVKDSKGGCEVTSSQDRKNIFEKIKNIIREESLLVSLGGVALLAFGVNIVEALCSAGLPAIFTGVLSMHNLPTLTYYLYLVLYVFIFMLDDLAVFFVAMLTLRSIGIESKYSRYSRLIGSLIMLVLGILLLVKPELLR